MSDLKLSVMINAIDKFSAPAQKIAGVSEQLATRLHDGQKALQALGRKGQHTHLLSFVNKFRKHCRHSVAKDRLCSV